MLSTPPLPKFLAAERLVLAMIVSAAVHSLMLFGIQYHAGVGGESYAGLDLAAPVPFQVRIEETPAPSSDNALHVALPGPAPASPAMPDSRNTVAPAATGRSPLPLESYISAGDLDVRPQIRDRVTPVYPEGAGQLSGKVIIKIMISASGTVDAVAVVQADPPGIFEESAIRAFSAARFTPGMIGQKAVKSMMALEVNYDAAEPLKLPDGAR